MKRALFAAACVLPLAAACEDQMYEETEPQEGEFAVGEDEDVNDRASTEASGAEQAELPMDGRPGGEATLDAAQPQSGGEADLLPFTARGNEPGWVLEMAGDQTRFDYDYGEQTVSFPTPERAGPENGPIRFEAPDRDFSAVLTRERCTSDSGMPYPFTVEVSYQGEPYRGCGGEPNAVLTGAPWRVVSIGGEDVPQTDTPPTIRFAETDAGGSTGCNTWRGGYTLTGETLTFEATATTRMACPEEIMALEQRFMDALSEVDRPALNGEELRLEGGGTAIVARRE